MRDWQSKAHDGKARTFKLSQIGWDLPPTVLGTVERVNANVTQFWTFERH